MKQEIVVNGEPMPLEQATLAELVEQGPPGGAASRSRSTTPWSRAGLGQPRGSRRAIGSRSSR